MSQTHVVWFKRDLRTQDHAPLVNALKQGPCICLYIYEPCLFSAPDFDASHLVFINESLAELRHRIRELGGELLIRNGDAQTVFEQLYRQHPFTAIHSHQETGNMVSYRRDQAVAQWVKNQGIQWHESLQHGVFRRLEDRDGWAHRWATMMRAEAIEEPNQIQAISGLTPGPILDATELGIESSTKNEAQHGGQSLAQETLVSFLTDRGADYRTEMSSPVTAGSGCSRLSPYLAYGNLSMRTVLQRTENQQKLAKDFPKRPDGTRSPWRSSLASFAKRLRWHCHFIQKLESQPTLEYQNMARAYDGLRENDFRTDFFDAWCQGQTGYPMVDACMRSLHETGWVNFRMRAMLMSFASYHLWLDWRPTSEFLARQFLDYEPGIHYSQAQMQSGTTGINSIRIYSPIKQVHDQDPQGVFIRKWVPELALVPAEFIAQPEHMPFSVQLSSGCVIGKNYPPPIVEHKAAVREARSKIFQVRARADARSEAKAVLERHGSRRRPDRSKRKKKSTTGKS